MIERSFRCRGPRTEHRTLDREYLLHVDLRDEWKCALFSRAELGNAHQTSDTYITERPGQSIHATHWYCSVISITPHLRYIARFFVVSRGLNGRLGSRLPAFGKCNTERGFLMNGIGVPGGVKCSALSRWRARECCMGGGSIDQQAARHQSGEDRQGRDRTGSEEASRQGTEKQKGSRR